VAKRGVLGGYLDTINYESSLLAERRGEDLIANQRGVKVDQAKMSGGSALLRYRHRLQVATLRVLAVLTRGLMGPV